MEHGDSSRPRPSTLVLCVDGLDYFLCKAWLADGSMPQLARLAAQGGYGRLETVTPAVSPVAWSSFLTGCNPARHGIFDFVTIDRRTLTPVSATLRRVRHGREWRWVNQRTLPGFPELATSGGIATAQVCAPVSFPAPADAGFVICGMETPDRTGGQGTGRLLCARPPDQAAPGIHCLEPDGDALTCTFPLLDGDPLVTRFTVSDGAAFLDGTRGLIELRSGEWTDWVELGPDTDPTVVQLLCKSIDPLSVYMSPLMYPPDHPLVVSAPDRVRGIVARTGLYPTLGYPYDTKSLEGGLLDDGEFLDQLRLTAGRLHDVAHAVIADGSAELVVAYFTEIDAVQHMFWREIDYAHAQYEKSPDARNAIYDAYRAVDNAIGGFLAGIDPRTAVFIVSDHGCQGFRQNFDVNRWLSENGYLSWADTNAGGDSMYWGVDWSTTRAYSYGMGRVAVNLAGRERYGIVTAGAEADALIEQLRTGLLAVRLSRGDGPAIGEVWRRDDVYQGARIADAPDLTIGFQPGLRSDSASAVGGRAPATLRRNTGKWSGDHASVDPMLVPGVLVHNRPLEQRPHRLMDLAPTILQTVGVDPPADWDGRSLLAGAGAAARTRTGA